MSPNVMVSFVPAIRREMRRRVGTPRRGAYIVREGASHPRMEAFHR